MAANKPYTFFKQQFQGGQTFNPITGAQEVSQGTSVNDTNSDIRVLVSTVMQNWRSRLGTMPTERMMGRKTTTSPAVCARPRCRVWPSAR